MNTRHHIVVLAALGLTAGFCVYLGPDSDPRGRPLAEPMSAVRSDGPAVQPVAGMPVNGLNIVLPAETGSGKLDPGLRALAAHTRESLAEARRSMHFLPEFVTDPSGTELMVELIGRDPAGTAAAVRALTAHGLHRVVSEGRLAAGWLPISAIPALEANADVISARALPRPTAHLGDADNQGDVAMLGNLVRERYAVDGKGIKVGIVSTSFNLAGTMDASITAGDLPGPGNPNGYTQPVRIVAEGVPGLFPANNLDEGRAMAELVHDVAPGAELLFASMQGSGNLFLAEAMERLAQAGADIIVDDIGLSAANAPFFQDEPAARKVDELAARGIHYFVSAGNHRPREMYEAPWTSRGFFNSATFDTFDFDPSDATFRPVMTVRPTAGAARYSGFAVIQWDEPWAAFSAPGVGAANSLRLLVLDPSNRVLLSLPSTIGVNPLLTVSFSNVDAASVPFLNIAILKPKDGLQNPGRIKIFTRLTDGEVDPGVRMLTASTIFGHANARSAFAIGASSWFNTPEGAPVWNRDFARQPTPDGSLIGTTAVPQTSVLSYLGGPSVLFRGLTGANLITGSSVGQQPILFDSTGARLASPEIRKNPSLIAPDAVQTSFFGARIANLSARPFFFGTSAAAPNAGAVAALLLQASRKTLNGNGLRNVLSRTAQDMDDPYDNGLQTDPTDPLFARGYDTASGYGLVQALPAVEQVIAGMGALRLSLSTQCQAGDVRRWRIDNPNGFGLLGNLSAGPAIRLPGETQFGASSRSGLLIPPGGLTFETPATPYLSMASAVLSWQYLGRTVGTSSNYKIGTWPTCP